MPHLLIILVIVVVLFGAGKLPKVMADLGRGVKNFKKGLDGEDVPEHPPLPPTIALPPTINAEVKRETDTTPRS